MPKLKHSQYKNEFGDTIHRVKLRTQLPEKGIIGFVHGIGEHIERYQYVFDFYLENGYSVYGFDSYGHGKSEGKRGHIHSQDQWLNEIQMLVEWIQSETDAPIILYGHSLGGLKTLLYLLKGKVLPNLAIVTSPFVEQGNPEPAIKISLGKMASHIFPKLTISNGLNVEGISRDKKVVEDYLNDPLNHEKVSLQMARIMFDSADELKKPHTISMPLLLQHGTADQLTSHNATKNLSENWKGDISFYSWKDGYHELHNEPNKKEFLEKTLAWLDAKVEEIYPHSNFINLDDKNLNYPTLLGRLSSVLDDKITFTNIEFDDSIDMLYFDCFNESYKVYNSIYDLKNNSDNHFCETLNTIIRTHIPYVEKFLVSIKHNKDNVLAVISYNDENALSLIKDFDSEKIYSKYRNFKLLNKQENCFVGLFEYAGGLNGFSIFFLKITDIDGDNFTGEIYEEEDFDERLNPILVKGTISGENISFDKVYEDKSNELAELFEVDESLFFFPEEDRTVKYSGKKYNNTFYGEWNKRESGTIFNGRLREETFTSGFWKMRKVD